jgi:hypothetical protein
MADGHALEVKLSNKGEESERESSLIKSGKNSGKVMVRNVHVQATRSELGDTPSLIACSDSCVFRKELRVGNSLMVNVTDKC